MFALALLTGCENNRTVLAPDSAETFPAPPANRTEAQAIAERFDLLAFRLETMTLPPQPLDGPERRRLLGDLHYLLTYLDAPTWREERILQLERRIAMIESDRTGVYSGDAQEFARQWEASEREINRIWADIHALRSVPAGAPEDAPASVALPRATERQPEQAASPLSSRGDIIGELEALLTPPGRLRARDKQVLRGRLSTLVAFLDAPVTRAEQIDELKNQLAALRRFQRIGPVQGSHELYDRYRQAIEAEAERLKDRIRRLETEGN